MGWSSSGFQRLSSFILSSALITVVEAQSNEFNDIFGAVGDGKVESSQVN